MTLDSAQYQRSAAAAGSGPVTQAAARVLAEGGNAIDAGVAGGFMLGVVHPDMVSFAGVAPILVHLASTGETFEVSGVGPYPRRVSADLFRTKHAGEIPIGLLRSVVPASPDAWALGPPPRPPRGASRSSAGARGRSPIRCPPRSSARSTASPPRPSRPPSWPTT